MKNWYIFKKLVLIILILAILVLQNDVVAMAKTDKNVGQMKKSESGWPYYPDGSLPFEWSKPGMASWNLDLDLTKAKPGDELAVKVLSSEYQGCSLIVTYAVPTACRELELLLDKYNMTLLAVSCLENNPDKKWSDKGTDIIYYCYALDDPITEHVQVHFYEDIGGIYGLSDDLLGPEASNINARKSYDDDSVNYYAFNFACDSNARRSSLPWDGTERARLDQYWGHSYADNVSCEEDELFATQHNLRVYNNNILKEMEEYIVEFRKVRGLPEL